MSKAMKKCQQCGNCCRQALIEVLEVDILREHQLIPQVDGKIGEDVLYLKLKGACPFLHPTLELCTIYQTRPTICVAHIPGTDKRCPQYDPDDEEYFECFTGE